MLTLWRSATMRAFMAGILAMGIVRFVLTIAGLPNSTAKYFSMSAVIAVGAVYFTVTTARHRDRLSAAFLLTLPYMTIEVLALLFTWVTGRQTVFHAAEYSFGFSIAYHTLGHLVGGFTWEPLGLFLLMELVWLFIKATSRLILKT